MFRSYFARNASISGALILGVYSGSVLKNWSLKIWGYHVVATTRVTGSLFLGYFRIWSLFGLCFKELELEYMGVSCRGDYPGHGFGKGSFFGFFRVFWLKRAKMD